MGYKYEYIKYLGSLQEPVKELIMEYEKKGRTIAELVSLLEQIGRPDVVHKLQEYIGRLNVFLFIRYKIIIMMDTLL